MWTLDTKNKTSDTTETGSKAEESVSIIRAKDIKSSPYDDEKHVDFMIILDLCIAVVVLVSNVVISHLEIAK